MINRSSTKPATFNYIFLAAIALLAFGCSAIKIAPPKIERLEDVQIIGVSVRGVSIGVKAVIKTEAEKIRVRSLKGEVNWEEKSIGRTVHHEELELVAKNQEITVPLEIEIDWNIIELMEVDWASVRVILSADVDTPIGWKTIEAKKSLTFNPKQMLKKQIKEGLGF